MAKDENFMMEFICFSVKETISNSKKNKNDDPSFKVIEDIMKKYGVNKEGAWSLYRPIFWYLSDQNVIRFENSSWNLHPEYQNTSEDMLNKLVNGVFNSYKDTLSARVEKHYDR